MAKKRVPPIDLATYGLVRALAFVITWTPEWLVYPTLYWCGRGLFVVLRGRRRIALSNLRQAFGNGPSDRELLRTASRATGSACMVLGDIGKMGRMLRSGEFEKRIDPSAYLERTGEVERDDVGPPVLCTPHLGSWEVAGMAIGIRFGRVHIIARPFGNPHLQSWILRTRSLLGQQIHPRRGGIRMLLDGLRAGEAVGTLPDQNQRTRGIFVPFFGKLASSDRSQARLAQMANSPIVVGGAVRIGKAFRFRIVVGDIFRVPPRGENARDEDDGGDHVYEATCRLHRAVEKVVLEAPDQYFWVHNRWRTRPPGEARPGGSPAKGHAHEATAR